MRNYNGKNVAVNGDVVNRKKMVHGKKGWMILGVTAMGLAVGAMSTTVSTDKVSASTWEANSASQIKARISANQKSIKMQQGDTVWEIGQALNVKDPMSLLYNNGFKDGDQYTMQIGTEISFDGNHVTVRDNNGKLIGDKVVKDSDKVNPSETVAHQDTDTPKQAVQTDAKGNVIYRPKETAKGSVETANKVSQATNVKDDAKATTTGVKPEAKEDVKDDVKSDAKNDATSDVKEDSKSNTNEDATSDVKNDDKTSNETDDKTSNVNDDKTSNTNDDKTSNVNDDKTSDTNDDKTSNTNDDKTSDGNKDADSNKDDDKTSDGNKDDDKPSTGDNETDGNKDDNKGEGETDPEVEQVKLTVLFHDDKGNTIAEKQVTTMDKGSKVSVDYPEIDGYTAKSGAVKDLEVNADRTIVLVYTKNSSETPVVNHTLTVNYEDTDGNALTEATKVTAKEGETVTVSAKEFEGYTLKSDKTQQVVMSKDSSVTFVYTKNAPQKTESTVKAQFKTADGTVIGTKSIKGKIGDKVDFKDAIPAGYHATTATSTTVGNEDSNFVITVAKDAPQKTESTVTAKFVTSDGQTIANKSIKGKIGDIVDFSKDVPTGYHATSVTSVKVGNEDSTFKISVAKDAPQKTESNVTAQFVTKDGSLVGTKTLKAKIGSTVDFKDSIPTGYHKTGATTAVVGKEDSTVKIQVEADRTQSTVTAQFKTSDGKVIATKALIGKIGAKVYFNSYVPAGYQATTATSTVVGQNDSTFVITVAPVKTQSTVTAQFKTVEGKVISTKALTGKIGSTVDFKGSIPAGYQATTATSTVVGQNDSTFVITVAPIKTQSTVTAQFKTSDGRVVGTASITGKIGDTVDFSSKVPAGYLLNGSAKAVVGQNDSTITINVKLPEVKKYNITVSYVDSTTGKALQANKVFQVEQNKQLTVTAPTINGYTVVGQSSKVFTGTADQTFSFTYAPVQEDFDSIEASLNSQGLASWNSYRATKGLRALDGNSALQSGVNVRAEEIATLFEHQRPNGHDPLRVANEMFGYQSMVINENITYSTYSSLAQIKSQGVANAMSAWEHSEGHNINLLTSTGNEGAMAFHISKENGVYVLYAVTQAAYNSTKPQSYMGVVVHYVTADGKEITTQEFKAKEGSTVKPETSVFQNVHGTIIKYVPVNPNQVYTVKGNGSGTGRCDIYVTVKRA